MAKLEPTRNTETYEDLCCIICWDDDDNPEKELAGGIYKTCAGEWRREQDGLWRFWQDPEIMAELLSH